MERLQFPWLQWFTRRSSPGSQWLEAQCSLQHSAHCSSQWAWAPCTSGSTAQHRSIWSLQRWKTAPIKFSCSYVSVKIGQKNYKKAHPLVKTAWISSTFLNKSLQSKRHKIPTLWTGYENIMSEWDVIFKRIRAYRFGSFLDLEPSRNHWSTQDHTSYLRDASTDTVGHMFFITFVPVTVLTWCGQEKSFFFSRYWYGCAGGGRENEPDVSLV